VGTSWFLDLNRFARHTPSAHGFMAYWAEKAASPLGAGLLVVLVVAACGVLAAKGKPAALTGTIWAFVGGAVTFGLCRALVPLVREPHPYQSLGHVELLVPRAAGFALPDTRTAIAAGMAAGLLLGRRQLLGTVAGVATVLLAFARVYVGAAFPADVAAGIGLGALVGLALWPVAHWALALVVPGAGGARPRRSLARHAPWLSRVPTSGARPARKLAHARPAAKLAANGGVMDARVIDALRSASEAARYANAGAASGQAGGEHGREGP